MKDQVKRDYNMRISTYLVESPFRKNPSRTQNATRTPSIKSNIFLRGLIIISFSRHLSETLGNKLKKWPISLTLQSTFILAIHSRRQLIFIVSENCYVVILTKTEPLFFASDALLPCYI